MKKVISIIMAVTLVLLLSCLLFSCGSKDAAGAPDSNKNKEEATANEVESDIKGEEVDKPEGKEDTDKKEKEMNTDNITINSQSSIKIEGSKTIYIDPYKRTEAVHDADLILITHAHYDHFDEPSLKNVAGDSTFVVCPDSMSQDVDRRGIGTAGTAYMEPGAEIKPEGAFEGALGGITIKAVPAYNLNKNFHPKSNGWLGYVINMDGVTFYAAGDTDALPELESIKCDVAFVPVGGTYTMTADEAAALVNKIKPQVAVPIHYGSIVGSPGDADTFKANIDDGIKVVTKVEDAK